MVYSVYKLHLGEMIVLVLLIAMLLSAPPTWGRELPLAPASTRSDTGKQIPETVIRTLMIGGALTALSTRYDQQVREPVTRHKLLEFGAVDIGDLYGNGAVLGVLSLGTWGFGQIAGHHELQKSGQMMAEALAIDFSLTTVIKFAVGRERPDHSDHRSFPSGHTSGAFTISTVLARRYGWRAALPLFALASATAYDRIEDRKHFLSDVVGAATLGIAAGFFVSRPEQKSESKIVLAAGLSSIGIAARF